MKELKVTLTCGISVDFTGKLDEPFDYIGTLADILNNYKTSKETEIQDVAITEIKNRAINYAHKALAGYNFRAMLADEAVKMLMNKLIY